MCVDMLHGVRVFCMCVCMCSVVLRWMYIGVCGYAAWCESVLYVCVCVCVVWCYIGVCGYAAWCEVDVYRCVWICCMV